MSDSIHGSIAPMSAAAMQEFPGADYIIAVRLPKDDAGNPIDEGLPTVSVFANTALTIAKELDLTGMNEIPAGAGPIQLMPRQGQIMKITEPDATVRYCTNVPSWWWTGLRFTRF